MSSAWLAASTHADEVPQDDAASQLPTQPLCRDAHSSQSSLHAFGSIDCSLLIARPPHHGGGDHGVSKENGDVDMHRGPPLQLTTHRLQVFSYVLAELSSATTLLPDYTKAMLNLSRRLIGAWQAVAAAAVARTRYERALMWAVHRQREKTDKSLLSAFSTSKTCHQGCRAFTVASRRSSRRRLRARKKRDGSQSDTKTEAVVLPSFPCSAPAPLDSHTSAHKRRRVSREATPASEASSATVTDRRAKEVRPHSFSPTEGDRPPQAYRASPRIGRKHLRAVAARALLQPSAAQVRRWRLVHTTLQRLWMDAQEAEDTTGQHVEYLRSLIVNALYQFFLQVTVDSSHNDLVLYRWLSPLLPGVCRGGVEVQQAGSSHSCVQRQHSPSVYKGGGSLRNAREHEAAVQVARDLLRLRYVLRRSRLVAAASTSPRGPGNDAGDYRAVVGSLSSRHRVPLNSSVLSPRTALQGAVCAQDRVSLSPTGEEPRPATGERKRDDNRGAAPRRATSAGGSQGCLGPSIGGASGGGKCVVPVPLHLFLRACLSFDPTHCALALMSRCVVVAQHVRANNGNSPVEYSGLFYVVMTPRTAGACACTALCFGNHSFMFIRCHDTEALIRETRKMKGSHCHGTRETSDVASTATAAEMEEGKEAPSLHSSFFSIQAATQTLVSSEGDGKVENHTHIDFPTQPPASNASAYSMTEAIADHQVRLSESRLHLQSPQEAKPTSVSRVHQIKALTDRDARRLKRHVAEEGSSDGRGLLEEEGPLHVAPLEMAGAPSMPSPVTIKRQLEYSPTEQAPSADGRCLSTQASRLLENLFPMNRASPTPPGHFLHTFTTVPTSLRLDRRGMAVPRGCTSLAADTSSPSLTQRGALGTSHSLTSVLQRTIVASQAAGALSGGEGDDAEGSDASELHCESGANHLHFVNEGASTRCIASPTRFIPISAPSPCKAPSTQLTDFSSSASLSRDIKGIVEDADTVDCARCVPPQHHEYPRVGLNDFAGSHTPPGGEVVGDNYFTNARAQMAAAAAAAAAVVVMHSDLCSCGVDTIVKEASATSVSGTAASTSFTEVGKRGFPEHSYPLPTCLDTAPDERRIPLSDEAQGVFRLSRATCAPNLDFSLSYFEQRVLLPPGGGQERRVVRGVSSSGELRDPSEASSIAAGEIRSCPTFPCTQLSRAKDISHEVGTWASKDGDGDMTAGHKASRDARTSEEVCIKSTRRILPDPEECVLHHCTHKNTCTMREGAGDLHHSREMRVGSDMSAVKPSEGDMAFAAELYARLQYWSLRGQDRSAYIDPSWRRQPSHRRAGEQEQAEEEEEGGKGRQEAHVSHDDLAHACVFQQRTKVVPHRPPTSFSGDAPGLAVHRPLTTEANVESAGSGVQRTSTPDTMPSSSLSSFPGASPVGDVSQTVLRPLRLLDCTVGVIEIEDETQVLAKRANHPARKRRCSAHAEPRHAKCKSTMEEFDDAQEEGDGVESEDKFVERNGDFVHLHPSTAVNVRGKALLFEALREATEVVVCGVRESRAHTGYHDLLHQRCPSPPSSPSRSNALRKSGDEQLEGYVSCPAHPVPADAAVEATATTGTPSGSTWLTTRSPWMAAAAAAAQECSFRVDIGTLSCDERNPFAFDTHRHLGMCGTVRWSQGDISHEEEAGDSSGDSGGGHGEMDTAIASGGSAFQVSGGAMGGSVHDSGSSRAPKWRWSRLPDNDHKQWRCELLKSEFRLARSRCLDCLLVDHSHGRPLAAITLVPWTSPQTSFDRSLDFAASDDAMSGGKRKSLRRDTDVQGLRNETSDVPSPQDVVQRTIYLVVGFTHYIVPLWRHLREEKVVMVDMDRTLIDDAITMHSAAERQRHICHLHRTVATSDGLSGHANPCVLWHRHAASPSRSSARFAGRFSGLGRNDAPQLTEDEVEESLRVGTDGELGSVLSCNSKGLDRFCPQCFTDRHTITVENDGVLRPTLYQRQRRNSGASSLHTQNTSDISALSSGGLLHRFMRRTVSQRQSLGIMRYEECGFVKYAARFSSACQRDSAAGSPPEGNRHWSQNCLGNQKEKAVPSQSSGDADAFHLSSEQSATAAAAADEAPSVPYLSDLVYVRPGVRQFLYRIATQWNIPLVLVTKSTRSRTEAILRQVLDPHGILFPDMQSNVVTADELLRWSHAEVASGDALGKDEGASKEWCLGLDDAERPSAVFKQLMSASGTSGVEAASCDPPDSPTSTPASMADRIMRCRKGALGVVQHALDANAMAAARRAWRPSMWCDGLGRLPKPRSIAVVDDAPQMWDEIDWPRTVPVAPYTLSRIDPKVYFIRRGYISSLVLSCLFGSKCLVCSEGVLRLPEQQGAETSPSSSSPYTSKSRENVPECRRLGAYRWPHCVCVCPPDHLSTVTRAAEDVPTGYSNASETLVGTGMSASANAMLNALLWRMSGKPAHHIFPYPLLLRQSTEDSLTAELAEQVMVIDGQFMASGRRRCPRHKGNPDTNTSFSPKDFASNPLATPEIDVRGDDSHPASVMQVRESSRIGHRKQKELADTVTADATVSTSVPSPALFTGVGRSTTSLASAFEWSPSISSPSSSSSRSLLSPTTVSTLFSTHPQWRSGLGNTVAGADADTASYTPTVVVTAASMPPTPTTFRPFLDTSLENEALTGYVEAEHDEQQDWCTVTENPLYITPAGGRDEATVNAAVMLSLSHDGYEVTTATRNRKLRSRSSSVEDVIPLEVQAASANSQRLRTQGSPSGSTLDKDGVQVDSASLSVHLPESIRWGRSVTAVPVEDVVPIPFSPVTSTEGAVGGFCGAPPPGVSEGELKRPQRRCFTASHDDVEDVTPL